MNRREAQDVLEFERKYGQDLPLYSAKSRPKKPSRVQTSGTERKVDTVRKLTPEEQAQQLQSNLIFSVILLTIFGIVLGFVYFANEFKKNRRQST